MPLPNIFTETQQETLNVFNRLTKHRNRLLKENNGRASSWINDLTKKLTILKQKLDNFEHEEQLSSLMAERDAMTDKLTPNTASAIYQLRDDKLFDQIKEFSDTVKEKCNEAIQKLKLESEVCVNQREKSNYYFKDHYKHTQKIVRLNNLIEELKVARKSIELKQEIFALKREITLLQALSPGLEQPQSALPHLDELTSFDTENIKLDKRVTKLLSAPASKPAIKHVKTKSKIKPKTKSKRKTKTKTKTKIPVKTGKERAKILPPVFTSTQPETLIPPIQQPMQDQLPGMQNLTEVPDLTGASNLTVSDWISLPNLPVLNLTSPDLTSSNSTEARDLPRHPEFERLGSTPYFEDLAVDQQRVPSSMDDLALLLDSGPSFLEQPLDFLNDFQAYNPSFEQSRNGEFSKDEINPAAPQEVFLLRNRR